MSRDLPPHLAPLVHDYARDLGEIAPTPSLDARIAELVASTSPIRPPARPPVRPARRGSRRPRVWAAAAGLGAVTVGAGILIGVEIERSRDDVADLAADSLPPLDLDPASLAMWPSDSVALTIPAEYSPEGTLVAVNPRARSTGKRYLIDVVVSNDGTIRIERIVPANPDTSQGAPDGQAIQ